MRCAACGVLLHDNDEYCRRCGSRVPARSAGGVEASGLAPPRRAPQDAEDDQEVVLWEGNYSLKAMFREVVLAVALTIVIPVACMLAGGSAPRFALPGVALIWLLLAGLTMYRKLDVFYRITNQRLIHENGILYRRINRIEIIDIDDLRCEQGLIERLLGIGRIVVGSSDRTHAWLVMAGVDRVRRGQRNPGQRPPPRASQARPLHRVDLTRSANPASDRNSDLPPATPSTATTRSEPNRVVDASWGYPFSFGTW